MSDTSATSTSPSVTSAASTTREPDGAGRRWHFIDALRGFALMGILFVNAVDLTGLGTHLHGHHDDPALDWLFLTVQTRFVPIFIMLFGASLYFVLDGARRRARRPWLVMIRRVVVLLGIGLLLSLVYPGNILPELGLFGLIVLPILLFVPRVWVLVIGLVVTGVTFGTGSQGLVTPGLMLLGAAIAMYGVPRRLERADRSVAIAFGIAALLTVPAILWQLTQPGDPRFSTQGSITGLVMAVLYATALSLIWRTRARVVIGFVFDPLGRMALSNYVAAAVILVGATLVVDFTRMTNALPLIWFGLALIAVQSAVSRIWLHYFRYGPLEWAWRMLTWWGRVPMLRARGV